MLTVSTRVRYGARALVYLAKKNSTKPMALHTIAGDEEISKKYLESIFHSLRNAGIVHSTRGPEGGYKLIKSPDQLSMREIVEAIDGPLNTVACVHNPGFCPKAGKCGTSDLWTGLLDINLDYLSKTSLADIAKKDKR